MTVGADAPHRPRGAARLGDAAVPRLARETIRRYAEVGFRASPRGTPAHLIARAPRRCAMVLRVRIAR
ncbi:hypothetical protein HBB16_20470 [Pseudonocardia sp. MCCB 268]|nr:hypothetical protein [Pseudonocardia cytotoxica]